MSNQLVDVQDLDNQDIERLIKCVQAAGGFWELQLSRNVVPNGTCGGKLWAYAFWSGGCADTVPIVSLVRASGSYRMRVWDIHTYCHDQTFEDHNEERVSDAFLWLHNLLDELTLIVRDELAAKGQSIIQMPIDTSISAWLQAHPDDLRRRAAKLRDALTDSTDDTETLWLRALASDLEGLAQTREQAWKISPAHYHSSLSYPPGERAHLNSSATAQGG